MAILNLNSYEKLNRKIDSNNNGRIKLMMSVLLLIMLVM